MPHDRKDRDMSSVPLCKENIVSEYEYAPPKLIEHSIEEATESLKHFASHGDQAALDLLEAMHMRIVTVSTKTLS